MRSIVSFGFAFLLVGAGCNSSEKKKEKEQAEEKKVDDKAQQLAQQMTADVEAKKAADDAEGKKKADEAERQKLEKSPQDLFEASGLKLLPSGGKNMQTVSAVTLTNKSKHLVEGIRAKVDFMKDGDVEVSLPLQLTGSLPAGGTRTFSTADNTLQAASVAATASETRVIVTAAHPQQDVNTAAAAQPVAPGSPNPQ